MKKKVWRHFVERLEPWYLLCGSHMGRSQGVSWNHFFRDRGAKGSQEGSAEVRGRTFCDF